MNNERNFKIKKIEKLNEDAAIDIEHMSALSKIDKIIGVLSGFLGIYSIVDILYQLAKYGNTSKDAINSAVMFSLCSFMCIYKHYDKEKTIDKIVDKEYKKIYKS